MPPPDVTYRGRFSRSLINLHSTVVSVSLTVTTSITDLLVQIFRVIHKRIHLLQSSTYLDLIEDIIGSKGFLYLSEAVVTGEFVFLLAVLCVLRRGVPHQDLELLRNNRLFLETIESNMPHVLRWYQAINGFDLKRRFMEYRDVFRNSPSILVRTPAEATRRHSEEIVRGLWRHPPASGKVRLYFFQTYHDRRHDPSQGNMFQHPDVCIDLDFDPNHGINLGRARKLLGVEKLSVLTGLSPHRATFDPNDQDNLSPLAVYDLSKQLREPIRVFEPCPSRITKIKRNIHDGLYASTYLVFTLLRSCLGFTLHDYSYLAVTFGDNFAARCSQLSQSIHPLHMWAREGSWLIAQLGALLVLLPLVAFFKMAVFVQSFLSTGTRSALVFLISFLVTVRDVFSFLSRLPWQVRIVVVVVSWITLADLVPTSRNS